MTSEVTGSKEGMPHQCSIWRLTHVKILVASFEYAQPCLAFHR